MFDRSINVKNLLKLLNNQEASLQVLQNLGFRRVKNRLLFEGDVSNPTDIINKVMFYFFELNPNISLRFQTFVRNIYTTIDWTSIPKCNVHTIADYQLRDKSDMLIHVDNANDMIIRRDGYDYNNVEAVINESMHQLPDNVLQDIASDINQYMENNDLSSLAVFLREKKISYYRNSIRVYNYYLVNQAIDKLDGLIDDVEGSIFIQSLSERTKIEGPNTCKQYIEDRLVDGYKIPKMVAQHLLEIFMQIELNFSDINDINLCYKIIQDTCTSVQSIKTQDRLRMKFNNIVCKYIHKVSMKKRFAYNMQILYITHSNHKLKCLLRNG